MARRANYGAEKRQRELKKKKKRDEKLERKRLANAPETAEAPAVDAENAADGSVDEAAAPAAETPAELPDDVEGTNAEPVTDETPEATPEKPEPAS